MYAHVCACVRCVHAWGRELIKEQYVISIHLVTYITSIIKLVLYPLSLKQPGSKQRSSLLT